MVEVLSIEEDSSERYRIDGVEYTVHPFAANFPWLEGARFDELLDDVRAHGVLQPVALWRGQIADGRNRLRAAALAELESVPIIRFPDDEDPTERIFRLNYLRRDLDRSKRAMILGKLVLYRQARAAAAAEEPAPSSSPPTAPPSAPAAASLASPEGPAPETVPPDPPPSDAPPERVDRAGDAAGGSFGASSASSPPVSFEKAVEDSGLSRQLVQKAATLHQHAPDLAKAVEADQVTVTDAFAIHKEPPAVRRRALKDVIAGKARTLVLAVEARKSSAAAPRARSGKAAPSSRDENLPPLPDAGGDASSAAGASDPEPASASPDAELLAPSIVLAGLRVALGTIDLDPCSTPFAQDKVGARDWFSLEQNGLEQHWQGSVWVFPPPKLARAFASKLDAELTAGRVTAAAFLAPARLATRWARLLLAHRSFLSVVVEGKSNPYLLPDGERVTPEDGMALFLLGDVQGDISRAFSGWGVVLWRRRDA